MPRRAPSQPYRNGGWAASAGTGDAPRSVTGILQDSQEARKALKRFFAKEAQMDGRVMMDLVAVTVRCFHKLQQGWVLRQGFPSGLNAICWKLPGRLMGATLWRSRTECESLPNVLTNLVGRVSFGNGSGMGSSFLDPDGKVLQLLQPPGPGAS